MASELKVDKFTGVTTAGSILVTGEGNSTTTNLQQGLCKAWVDLTGTSTVGINDSFNTSGITDEGTGHYSNSFTNNFASANYVRFGSATFFTSNNFHVVTIGDNNGAAGTLPTTSGYQMRTPYVFNASAAAQDCTIVNVGNVGDLA